MSTILQKYFSAGSARRVVRRPPSLPSRCLPTSGNFWRLKKKCGICRVCVAIRKNCACSGKQETLPPPTSDGADERRNRRFRPGKKSAAEDADLAKLRGFFPAAKPEKEKVRGVSAADFPVSRRPMEPESDQPSAVSNAVANASMSAALLVSVVQARRTFSSAG